MSTGAILALLIGVLILMPFVAESRRRAIDGIARNDAPGLFVELTRGVTHYQWYGPAGGPVIVCVHGLTTPSYVWEGIARRLAVQGYRVLTYDLYGRGFSDRPRGDQTSVFFVQQLDELLQTQKIARDFTLMGYSMGGSIATAYAARFPERLNRLVLIASAGLSHRSGSLAEICRKVPWLGDWLMLTYGGMNLRFALERQRRTHPDLSHIIDKQLAETRTRGFLRSVLSSQRHMLAERLQREQIEIARHDLSVIAFWGGRDTVIPPVAEAILDDLNIEADQIVVAEADHWLPISRPDAVVNALIVRIGVP